MINVSHSIFDGNDALQGIDVFIELRNSNYGRYDLSTITNETVLKQIPSEYLMYNNNYWSMNFTSVEEFKNSGLFASNIYHYYQ